MLGIAKKGKSVKITDQESRKLLKYTQPSKAYGAAVWSKGMCLMDRFNFIPNCVVILPVLSSGYQMLAIFEMFIVRASWGYSFK